MRECVGSSVRADVEWCREVEPTFGIWICTEPTKHFVDRLTLWAVRRICLSFFRYNFLSGRNGTRRVRFSLWWKWLSKILRIWSDYPPAGLNQAEPLVGLQVE